MKTFQRLFYCLFFSCCLTAHAQTNDSIYWSANSVLAFSDFQAKPVTLSGNDAISSITIDFEYTQFAISGKITSVKVFCYFNRVQSWIKKIDNNLLEHERGHFNLGEIFARKFRKKIAEYFDQQKTMTYDDLQNMYRDISVIHEAEDRRYDFETDHSKEKNRQLEWNKKIDELLLSLVAFKD